MSRATVSKSRADKTKGSQNAPTPAVAHEVVPGKFNDNDWNVMVDRDDGEEIASDILGDLCDNVLDVIYQNYIQRQLLPYTIAQAKDAILQIVEWQFLSRDEGEEDTEGDPSWMEDEEPSAAVTDCWAQGSVPRQMAPPVSTIEEEDTCVTTGETSQSDTGVEDVEEDDIKEDLRLIKEATLEPVIDSKEETTSEEQKETDKENTDVSETKVPPKKKNKFRPYKGRINSASYKYMHQSLEDTERMYREYETVVPTPEEPSEKQKTMPASCQSIVKVQAGRPPGTRDVQYDEVGNVIGVVKINRNKLPSHRVNTRYHVVDPAVEAAQARLEAMRTGKFLDKHHKAKKIAPVIITAPSVPASEFYTSTVGAPVSTRMTGTTTMSKYDGKRGAVTPLPPPLIESMEVQPGVVVREGNRIKKGPRTYRKGVNIMLDNASVMQPVTMQAGMPLISAAQILEHQTPLVRPLGSAGIIPPIKMTPHPPSRAQVN